MSVNMIRALVVALAVAGVTYVVLAPSRADALANPMGSLQAAKTSVTTTAEKVTDEMTESFGWKSCRVWNNSATVLYIGGDDVDSTEGYPLCTDTAACPEAALSVDASTAYYVAASGTLTPNVICGR